MLAPSPSRALHSLHTEAACAGSQPKRHPSTTRMVGSNAASALTAVDFPVPRSPNTNTPPIVGSTAAMSSARFISSWPTMAENGKGRRMLERP